MRVQPTALAIGVIVLLAAGIGWALLAGRDRPVHPELGPAVHVELATPTGEPTTQPREASTRRGRPGPPDAHPRTMSPLPGSSTPAGARTVPRHAPAPAGDDADDDDEDDDDRDDVVGLPDADDDD